MKLTMKPTARQWEVFDFISDYRARHGYPPVVREMCDHFNVTINGIRCHMDALKRKGFITWQDGQARTIQILKGKSPKRRPEPNGKRE